MPPTRLIPPAPSLSEQLKRKEGAEAMVSRLTPKIPAVRRTVERTARGEVAKSANPVELRTEPVCWAIPFDEVVFTRWVTHFIGQRFVMPWDDTITDSGTYISEARNTLHQQFVTTCKLDWLVMLDSDVLPPPNFINTLMSHNLPMVGGWYKKKGDPYPPCVYDFVHEDDDKIAWWKVRDKPGVGLEKVDGAGAGCWLMHRSVAEALGERPYNPHVLSEDFLLCRKLSELGIDVFIDWSVNCAHAGVAIA